MEKVNFTSAGKIVTVYPCDTDAASAPVVYLNTFAEEGGEVYKFLCESGCSGFCLVTVSNLDWNDDMSPWEIPPIAKNDTSCTGGADKYLELLSEEIMPAAEKHINTEISRRCLAGYSLAGLFAVYSMYRTDLFADIASMSGSLWFPHFKEYIFSHETMVTPKHIYFSLGDRESKTNNPYLRTVQTDTEETERFYREKGIDTIFQLNRGNHYKDAAERTASGIAWILKR